MDPVIAAILTTIGVVGAAWITARVSGRKNRSDATMQLVDQHQEDIAVLRSQVARLERTQRIQGDYIGELRQHIVERRDPPPPPYPPGLIT